jgi:hypothetical protein
MTDPRQVQDEESRHRAWAERRYGVGWESQASPLNPSPPVEPDPEAKPEPDADAERRAADAVTELFYPHARRRQ